MHMSFKTFPGIYYQVKVDGDDDRLLRHYAYHALRDFYVTDLIVEPNYTTRHAYRANPGNTLAGVCSSYSAELEGLTHVMRKLNRKLHQCTMPKVSCVAFHSFVMFFSGAKFVELLPYLGEEYGQFETTLSGDFWRKLIADYSATIVLFLITEFRIKEDPSFTGIPIIPFHGKKVMYSPIVFDEEVLQLGDDSNIEALVAGLPSQSALITEIPHLCSGCVSMAPEPDCMSTGTPHQKRFGGSVIVQKRDGTDLLVIVWCSKKKDATKILRTIASLDSDCLSCRRQLGWEPFKTRFMSYVKEYPRADTTNSWQVREFMKELLSGNPGYAACIAVIDVSLSSDRNFKRSHYVGDSLLTLCIRNLDLPPKLLHTLCLLAEPNQRMSSFVSERFSLDPGLSVKEIFGERSEVHARGSLFECLLFLCSQTSEILRDELVDDYLSWLLISFNSRVLNDELLEDFSEELLREGVLFVLNAAVRPVRSKEIRRSILELYPERDVTLETRRINNLLHGSLRNHVIGNSGLWSLRPNFQSEMT